MKVKISADSTCDLSQEILEKYNIGIVPLFVALGDRNLLDGESVCPDDIYDYYKQTKKLPKTGARSVDEYHEYFSEVLKGGYDAIVHFTISADMSASFANATKAAEKLKNVFVVDSRTLSTGIGLLVLDACDMAAQGKSAKYIAERASKRVGAVESSFVIDSLEFLYKGGRCSSLAYFGANLLQLKPSIIVKDGKMGTWNKFQGKYPRCVQKYVEAVHNTYTNPDKTRCFVTHTALDDGIAESVVETVKSWGIFDEVLETYAGCTVTTHCGAGTIGVLFINDGGME